ncbi:unnamed protein product [Choristocarpus tenellus]
MWTTVRITSRKAMLAPISSRSLSAQDNSPAKIAALVYSFVDGMLEKRTPHRSEHLDLLNKMTNDGTCLMGGAFADPCDGSVVFFSSRDKAQEFLESDPYFRYDLVTSYQIRDYMAVTGSLLKK